MPLCYERLGEECKLLWNALAPTEDEYAYDRLIWFKAPQFYYKNDGKILVTKKDVDELFRGDCLCISIIQLYML